MLKASYVCPGEPTSEYCRKELKNTQGDSDLISSYHIYARHDVGQPLRNVCY